MKRPLNLLFVNRGMGLFRGGGETYTLYISKLLIQKGHKISFLIGKPICGVKQNIDLKNVHYCFWLQFSIWGQKLKRGEWIFRRIDDWLFTISSIIYILTHKLDYDILVLFGVMPQFIYLKKWKKTSMVIRCPGPPAAEYHNLLKQFDAIIVSGDTERVIRDANINAEIIHPAVDCSLFTPRNNSLLKKNLGFNGKKIILWVGRIVPLKRVDDLISSLAKILISLDAILLIVGEGAARKSAEEITAKLGLHKNVLFLGNIENNLLPEYYNLADVFVVSSIYESFSIVTLEAMSCGKPVVSMDVGYLSKLVKNNLGGLLVRDGDWDTFCESVKKILMDDDLQNKMGCFNRNFVVNNFSWEKNCNEFEDILYRLL